MKSPIKELLVSSLLYLPLCFFIWFTAATLLILPVHYLAEWILTAWQPDLFNGISQTRHVLSVETLIFPQQQFAGQGDKLAVLDVTVNPLIYGYGLAVFAGLTISVPALGYKKKIIQLLIAYGVVCLLQANGVFWETCKSLLFSGGDAFDAINATGISHNLVAAMYQLSYLILTPVVPIFLWIVLNQKFIETLIEWQQTE
ncbi:MAG: hypothetical protein DWP95_12830 [Proteobacteria bacterium]|nr:MAG: hypothetical protein DWP95_12830 [Pseudomonadota bacterium]